MDYIPQVDNQNSQQPINKLTKNSVNDNINEKFVNSRKNALKRILLWLTIIATILIVYYCFFATSALTIAPIYQGTRVYLNDQSITNIKNKSININARFRIYHLTISENGYASYQKKFLFMPFFTKPINVNLSKITTVSFPVVSKIIDNGDNLKLISQKAYRIFTLEQKDLTRVIDNNQLKSLEDILQTKNNNIELDFLSDFTDYGLPNNFSILDDLVLFQITNSQSRNFLMIYSIKKEYVVKTLPNIKSYSIFDGKIYVLNDKSEITYIKNDNLEKSEVVTKIDNQGQSIYSSGKGLYVLVKAGDNNSIIEYLDSKNKITIIDQGIITDFMMNDNSRDNGFYNKMEKDKVYSYIIEKTKKTKLKQYFPFVSFLPDGSYFGYEFGRINDQDTQAIETKIYKNQKVIFRLSGEDKISNIYYFKNYVMLFYPNKVMILPSI